MENVYWRMYKGEGLLGSVYWGMYNGECIMESVDIYWRVYTG